MARRRRAASQDAPSWCASFSSFTYGNYILPKPSNTNELACVRYGFGWNFLLGKK
ncbi:MAG: hypothetical protein WD063_11380 [Pirellulales bacterium]